MRLELEISGPPRFEAGRCIDRPALYLAIVYATTTPKWHWWRVWHLRLAWPPVRKAVDNFVETEDDEG